MAPRAIVVISVPDDCTAGIETTKAKHTLLNGSSRYFYNESLRYLHNGNGIVCVIRNDSGMNLRGSCDTYADGKSG